MSSAAEKQTGEQEKSGNVSGEHTQEGEGPQSRQVSRQKRVKGAEMDVCGLHLL